MDDILMWFADQIVGLLLGASIVYLIARYWFKNEIESLKKEVTGLKCQKGSSTSSEIVSSATTNDGESVLSPDKSNNIETAPNERAVLLQWKPKEIVDLIDEHMTTSEIDRIINPFIGKSLRVSGKVRDVVERSDKNIIAVFLDDDEGVSLLLFYDEKWEGKLNLTFLKKGEIIKTRGIFLNASKNSVSLKNCEPSE